MDVREVTVFVVVKGEHVPGFRVQGLRVQGLGLRV